MTSTARFDRIFKIVDARIDVRNPTLAHLIHTSLDTKHHVLTIQVRAEFADQVPQAAFDLIEDCCRIAAHQGRATATETDARTSKAEESVAKTAEKTDAVSMFIC